MMKMQNISICIEYFSKYNLKLVFWFQYTSNIGEYNVQPIIMKKKKTEKNP